MATATRAPVSPSTASTAALCVEWWRATLCWVRVTLVVPAYNVAGAIEATLKSITALDPPAHEVLIINDGSSDATGDILRAFQEQASVPGLRIFEQHNQGVSVARNVGIREATGDYVVFVDGDDAVAPQLVEKVSQTAGDEPADIICWRSRHLEYESLGVSLDHIWSNTPARASGLDTLLHVVVHRDRLIWTGSAAYRVGFLRANALTYTPGCASAQDIEFLWKALSLAAEVTFVDAPLSTYIWRQDSTTHSISVSRFDGVLAYQRAADFILGQGPAFRKTAEAAQARVIPRYMDYLLLIARDRPAELSSTILQADRRNPGLTRHIRLLIVREVLRGRRMPRRWRLFAASPKLFVLHSVWTTRRRHLALGNLTLEALKPSDSSSRPMHDRSQSSRVAPD